MNFINNLTDDLLNGTHDLPCPIINASYQHGYLPCDMW